MDSLQSRLLTILTIFGIVLTVGVEVLGEPRASKIESFLTNIARASVSRAAVRKLLELAFLISLLCGLLSIPVYLGLSLNYNAVGLGETHYNANPHNGYPYERLGQYAWMHRLENTYDAVFMNGAHDVGPRADYASVSKRIRIGIGQFVYATLDIPLSLNRAMTNYVAWRPTFILSLLLLFLGRVLQTIRVKTCSPNRKRGLCFFAGMTAHILGDLVILFVIVGKFSRLVSIFLFGFALNITFLATVVAFWFVAFGAIYVCICPLIISDAIRKKYYLKSLTLTLGLLLTLIPVFIQLYLGHS